MTIVFVATRHHAEFLHEVKLAACVIDGAGGAGRGRGVGRHLAPAGGGGGIMLVTTAACVACFWGEHFLVRLEFAVEIARVGSLPLFEEKPTYTL